ncbi:hypothetical protein CCH79_00016471 [Gambusia affinis]|uniref:Bactericidal permeability-increasing protein n=1 Tax=Gambusia affinis TaxID=33528 RepID=A0A315VKB4_GAMAF|nr:hypothetical protein CCH79_00016471 [Gambusia affinis]
MSKRGISAGLSLRLTGDLSRVTPPLARINTSNSPDPIRDKADAGEKIKVSVMMMVMMMMMKMVMMKMVMMYVLGMKPEQQQNVLFQEACKQSECRGRKNYLLLLHCFRMWRHEPNMSSYRNALPVCFPEVMSALSLLLVLLAVASTTLSVNPGVTVRLTDKGLQYGKQLGIAAMQEKLKSIQIPDFSGSESVSPIGKVKYSLTNIQLVNVGLPRSAVALVPGTGVRLTIGDAFMNLHGNWRVKYLRVIKDSGSFDVNVNGLTISTSIVVKSDATGRPVVSSTNCVASVASAKVKFHGGASWLYNLFSKFINKALRNALQKQICPLVDKTVTGLNPKLQTLNVLAKVDKYAEIEYSMVSSPVISQSTLDLNLKGQFYNIGKHQEPPFTPAAFSLPSQNNNMVYMALSAFTANSAGFVYNKAGVLSLYITDDMVRHCSLFYGLKVHKIPLVPKGSPFRLNTKTFGVFIPQIAKQYPGLMMKLLLRAENSPTITFQPKNTTAVATATVTAYAIQPNGTLSPLFILNLESSVSADVYVRGLNIAGRLTLNQLKLSVGTSYVGQFQVGVLDSVLRMVLKVVVIPIVNVQLDKGYPLPAIGKMNLVNPQLQIMKDYMLIGTDVNFTGEVLTPSTSTSCVLPTTAAFTLSASSLKTLMHSCSRRCFTCGATSSCSRWKACVF